MHTSMLKGVSLLLLGALSACGPRYVQAPAPVDRGSYLVHIVTRSGETPRSVARWYTGSERSFREIAQISDVSEGGELKLGQRILIPTFLVKKTTPPAAGSVRPKSTKKGALNKRSGAEVESDEDDSERDERAAAAQDTPGGDPGQRDVQPPSNGVGGSKAPPSAPPPTQDAPLDPVDLVGVAATPINGAPAGTTSPAPAVDVPQPPPAPPKGGAQTNRSAEDELLAALAASDTTIPPEPESPPPVAAQPTSVKADSVAKPPVDQPAPGGGMESLEEMLRREQSEVQRLRDELKANVK
jgi:hypothetical protein